MKKTVSVIIILSGLIVISCNNNKDKETDRSVSEMTQTPSDTKPADNTASSAIPADMQNILGEWTLVRTVRDDNGNHKIDGEEEKTAIMDPGGYMKFNSGGTCKFQSVMDGKFQVITEDDGRKRLDIKDLSGTPYPIKQYIISVSDKELVINNVSGGSDFDVYKRQ